MSDDWNPKRKIPVNRRDEAGASGRAGPGGQGGGLGPIVAKHYNELEEKGHDARQKSRIIHMRSFNNWIKSMIISDVVLRCKGANLDNLCVLDLCCGKGGDINKWEKSRIIRHVVFADIAKISVEHCEERYSKLGGYRGRKPFSAQFISTDCTKDRLRNKYDDPNIEFDIVSCQFSFHYSFESLSQTKMMLQNISENLKPGGYFIGTIPDANTIISKLRVNGGKSFSNAVFNIKCDLDMEGPIPLFGSKYFFHMDEVVNCPEFLVYFPAFEKLAKDVGLKLLFKHDFEEFFHNKRPGPDGQFLLERMSALETYPPQDRPALTDPAEYEHAKKFLEEHSHFPCIGTLSKAEWGAISLYLVFAFVKEPLVSSQ